MFAEPQNWIAVASADHVEHGKAGGFMQVCHGKAAPLNRLAPDDYIAYYSPTTHFGKTERLQAFTAIGVVKKTPSYQVDMGNGFHPYRRDVFWYADAQPIPVRTLLSVLEFTQGKTALGLYAAFWSVQNQ